MSNGTMATIKTSDITSAVALYGAAAPAVADRPFGVPPEGLGPDAVRKRGGTAAVLLEQLGTLLDVLQKAHRAGDLTPDDIRNMQQVELWYSALQAEAEHLKLAATPAMTAATL